MIKNIASVKTNNVINTVLLVIIYLLLLVVICVDCYFYYTKYRQKKHLLPFQETTIKLDIKNV